MADFAFDFIRSALRLDGLLWFYLLAVIGLFWTARVRLQLWVPAVVLLGSLVTFLVAGSRPFTSLNDPGPLVMMGATLMAVGSMAVLYVSWFQRQLQQPEAPGKPTRPGSPTGPKQGATDPRVDASSWSTPSSSRRGHELDFAALPNSSLSGSGVINSAWQAATMSSRSGGTFGAIDPWSHR